MTDFWLDVMDDGHIMFYYTKDSAVPCYQFVGNA